MSLSEERAKSRELFDVLLTSSSTYISSQIFNHTNKEWYLDAIREIQSISSISPSLAELHVNLLSAYDAIETKKFGWVFFSSPKKYTQQAYLNAIDIIDSIILRFITGGESVHYIKK